MGFQKLKPKIIAWRDYKNFDNVKFRYDIVTAASNVDNFGMCKSTLFNIFKRHVPIKKKCIRANEASLMSKELYKTIMKKSNKKNYSTQKNFCKKLLNNTKKSYFENLDT